MIAWFLIAIGTVAFFAYIAVSGVTTVNATGTIAGRADTLRRIDAVAATLMARSTAIRNDGVIYLPAGISATGEYLLPRDMQAAGLTTFGSRFQYCPMGVAAANSPNDTVGYQGGSYQITTASLNGRDFVTEGRMSTAAADDQNVMGFVIAQLNPETAMPGCGQIVRNGEFYTAPNGIVRVLRRSQVAEVDASRNSDGATWYVSPNGNGDGRSWTTAASLTSALAAYRNSLGGTFTIRLANGSYDVSGNPLDQTLTATADKKAASALLLLGSGTATINTSAINVPSDLELRNVKVPNSYILTDRSHTLKLTDTTTGPLVIQGRSRLLMNGTNVVVNFPGVGAAIQLTNGSNAVINNNLYLYYQQNLPAMTIDASASATLASAYVNVQPVNSNAANKNPSLFVLNPNSTLTFKSSTIDVNGSSEWAFSVGGKLGMYDTRINFNAYTWVGLQTLPGGDMSLNAIHMQGSSLAQYAMAAQSSAKVSGWGNLYAGTRCWYRGDSSLFRLSSLGVTGDVSTVSPDEGWATMSAQPTRQEVADYQAMRQRNIERADLRSRVNTSYNSFACQQAPQPTWQSCSVENGYCALPAVTGGTAGITVRYGINGNYRYIVTRGGIPCNNAVFGDPAVGTLKYCDYAS